MTLCNSYIPTASEELATLQRLVPAEPRHPIMSGSRCVACNKILEPEEQGSRGYASGEELGTCRRCTAEINTPADIEAAEKKGHSIQGEITTFPHRLEGIIND